MQASNTGESPPAVLLIEDEETIVEFLRLGLGYEGFVVEAVADGRHALAAFDRLRPQLVLLDLMLPGVDGLTVCRQLRARSDVPIIVLTALGEVADRVIGLDSGADDYLPKPFKFPELMARIRAVLRRHQVTTGHTLVTGNLRLDRRRREATDDGRPLALTPREYALLECLMLHPRHVLSRETILNYAWGYEQAVETNVVDVYVRTLRQKLGDDRHERLQAVHGVGYVLRG